MLPLSHPPTTTSHTPPPPHTPFRTPTTTPLRHHGGSPTPGNRTANIAQRRLLPLPLPLRRQVLELNCLAGALDWVPGLRAEQQPCVGGHYLLVGARASHFEAIDRILFLTGRRNGALQVVRETGGGKRCSAVRFHCRMLFIYSFVFQ